MDVLYAVITVVDVVQRFTTNLHHHYTHVKITVET
jgi:hypothetical protein